MSPTLTDRQRKILYRANHRGMKETDVLLGGFASARLTTLSETELNRFEALLEELDADVMDWVIGKLPLPAHLDADLFQKIMAFRPYA